MGALHRVAEAERERLFRIRSLYKTGLYWKSLFVDFINTLNASGKGRCDRCGRFGNLYLFSQAPKRLCKACMEDFLRFYYRKQ